MEKLTFQAFSWYVNDGERTDCAGKKMTVHVFGKVKEGESVCAHVTGFQPCICVGFPACSREECEEDAYSTFFELVQSKMKTWLRTEEGRFKVVDEFEDHLLRPDRPIVERKPMWGFTQEKQLFFKFNFRSLFAYNKIVGFLKAVHGASMSVSEIERFCGFYESLSSRSEQNGYIEEFSNDRGVTTSVLRWFVKINAAGLRSFAKLQLFEIIDPILRFAHGKGLKMAGWMEAEYFGRDRPSTEEEKTSNCEIEFATDYDHVKSIECDDICRKIKEMAFDIESYSFNDMFTNPEQPENYVYQIGITMKDYSERDTEARRYLMHFKTPKDVRTTEGATGECLAIANTTVENFETEQELLLGFADLVTAADPDIIYGYNSDLFDWSYLMKRARTTGCIDVFARRLSRIKGFECRLEEASFSSSAYGDNKYLRVSIPGRLVIDLMIWIQRNMPADRYPNYKLDTVAEIEIKEKKRDVKPKDIFKAFRSGEEAKCTVIGDYCCQDTILVQKLVSKLDVVTQMFEMANITDTPPMYLLHKGQQIKVFSQISKKAEEKGYLIPYVHKKDEGSFKGAIVLDVKTGRYDTPVSVLDFASLYPSVMMAYKICYSTIVLDEGLRSRLVGMKDGGADLVVDGTRFDYIEWEDEIFRYQNKATGANRTFRSIEEIKEQAEVDDYVSEIYRKWKRKAILDSISKGNDSETETWRMDKKYHIYFYAQNVDTIIPELQMELKKSRKAVKRMMAPFEHSKNQDEQLRYRVLNGRQLAIKVSMNSIYGFTSAFMLNLPALSASVTAKGRQMIETTRDFMEQKFETIAKRALWSKDDVITYITKTGAEVKSDAREVDTSWIKKFPSAIENRPWTAKPTLAIQVVGGDTDSCFCHFPTSTIAEAISLCHKAEELITNVVFNRAPIEIEYEKTYCPMVYQKKKSYVGKKFEMDDARWKIDYKGIAVKRRNYCAFVKEVFWSIIYPSIGVEKTATGDLVNAATVVLKDGKSLTNGSDLAVEALKSSLDKMKDAAFEKFVISASLKAQYKNDNLPHIQLVKRMKERDPGSEPQPGQRFGYVVVDDPERGNELTQKSEDPSFAQEHGLRLDYIFYLKQQIEKPITTYMSLLGKAEETKAVFDGKEKEFYDEALKRRQVLEIDRRKRFFEDVKNHVETKPMAKLKALKRKRCDAASGTMKITSFFSPAAKKGRQ